MGVEQPEPARNALLAAAQLAGHGLDWARVDLEHRPGDLWCVCGAAATREHHLAAAMDFLGVPAAWRPFVEYLLDRMPLMSWADLVELAARSAIAAEQRGEQL